MSHDRNKVNDEHKRNVGSRREVLQLIFSCVPTCNSVSSNSIPISRFDSFKRRRCMLISRILTHMRYEVCELLNNIPSDMFPFRRIPLPFPWFLTKEIAGRLEKRATRWTPWNALFPSDSLRNLPAFFLPFLYTIAAHAHEKWAGYSNGNYGHVCTSLALTSGCVTTGVSF